MIHMSFEQLANIVTEGDFVMDVNMEMEYKGYTIIVDSINGENPFGETEAVQGCYPKVCIVPEGEYKWIATAFSIDCAKNLIDRWEKS